MCAVSRRPPFEVGAATHSAISRLEDPPPPTGPPNEEAAYLCCFTRATSETLLAKKEKRKRKIKEKQRSPDNNAAAFFFLFFFYSFPGESLNAALPPCCAILSTKATQRRTSIDTHISGNLTQGESCEAEPLFIIKKQKNKTKKAELCYYATTLCTRAVLCIDLVHNPSLILFLFIYFWFVLFHSLLPELQHRPDVIVSSLLGVRAAHLADQPRRVKAMGSNATEQPYVFVCARPP